MCVFVCVNAFLVCSHDGPQQCTVLHLTVHFCTVPYNKASTGMYWQLALCFRRSSVPPIELDALESDIAVAHEPKTVSQNCGSIGVSVGSEEENKESTTLNYNFKQASSNIDKTAYLVTLLICM